MTAEDGEALTGARLGEVSLELGRKFGIDMAQARGEVEKLRQALADTWEGIDAASLEVGGREKAKTKICRQLGRVAELDGLFDGDDAAQDCIEAVRHGLRLLEGIASEAAEDSAGELAALKRHAVALRDVLQPVSEQQAAPVCGICWSSPVSRVAIPCGHAVCGRCSSRQQGSCFFCRQRCSMSRLFFAR